MAISKERLQELIEQGSTIWSDIYEEIKLDKNTCEICEVRSLDRKHWGWILCFLYNENKNFYEDVNIEDLEENIEKGKWERDFSVNCTVNLSLPTWEQFQKKDDISFICPKSGHEIYIYNYDYLDIIKVTNTYNINVNFEYTKDGYISACKKCLELFLGE